MRPALAGVTGGLSGPAIRPVAVRAVYQVHAAFPEVPILGMGGIRNGLDALEFVLAGASAVSVGTAIFHDPSAPVKVLAQLRDALAERGFERFTDAIGYAHREPEPVSTSGGVVSVARYGADGTWDTVADVDTEFESGVEG
jgi:dihydroorotate dehydrogenase (NAD+) catalytic subunit